VVFSLVVIVTVAVWYPVYALVRRQQPVPKSIVAGGVLVTLLALVLLHFPYRLMYANNVFQVVNWNSARCYVIGERADARLLFCPLAEPPRNRIVSTADRAVIPLGVTESVFSQFSAAPQSPVREPR
jgi:hypothetical protein